MIIISVTEPSIIQNKQFYPCYTITNATSDAFGAITIVAQAIQADGFDSWEDAFTAFDAE